MIAPRVLLPQSNEQKNHQMKKILFIAAIFVSFNASEKDRVFT